MEVVSYRFLLILPIVLLLIAIVSSVGIDYYRLLLEIISVPVCQVH